MNPLTTNDTTPILNGSFDSADSAGLSVAVNGVTYVLGTDAELTNVGDAWTLDLSASAPLAAGTYGVTTIATDAAGNSTPDVSSNELVVYASTLTFQEGTASYTGTEDTFLDGPNPDTSHGADTTIEADLDGFGGLETQTLIRFDSIFGSGPNQIPFGSTINSASLILEVTGGSASGASITLHSVLVNWDESSTWNSMSGGLQRDDAEVSIAADATVINPDVTGSNTITGLAVAVQAWSDGAANYGWAIFNDSTNGWDFASAEFATVSLRPQLIVDFTPPVAPAAVDDPVTYSNYVNSLSIGERNQVPIGI